eukprot:CAMPEP_0116543632 /NCGR_PEP_ID=MMETSP0397-20121206/1673_1 /TAXON_ID=216820 /ORGANISM="Cyclophora tenuis, Strain ECT3854" /LENGTH=205 /DNA_ID=CAMNT_0004067761 /DNA_START=178 /DNA_END=795 /DNA_ORIENTATION=+
MLRTLQYWELKEEVFGEQLAYRRVTLQDLDDDDLATARNYGLWVLPKLDKAGRAVVYSRKPLWLYKHRNNFLRWMWFILEEEALAKPTVQRNGVVLLAYDDGPFTLQQFDRKLESRFFHMMGDCLPLRWSAIHHFYDSKVHDYVTPFLLFMMGPKMRARYRTYPGNKRHTRLPLLEEKGISKGILPEIMGGKDNFDIVRWIEARK